MLGAYCLSSLAWISCFQVSKPALESGFSKFSNSGTGSWVPYREENPERSRCLLCSLQFNVFPLGPHLLSGVQASSFPVPGPVCFFPVLSEILVHLQHEDLSLKFQPQGLMPTFPKVCSLDLLLSAAFSVVKRENSMVKCIQGKLGFRK